MSHFDCSGKRVAILGLGKSGFESAKFLKNRGASVFVSELKSDLLAAERKEELERLGIEVELGSHNKARILGAETVVISPGISPKTELYRMLRENHARLWSEIELAYRFCPAPIVAVTGTNGKTTVTTLISNMFREQGFESVCCGNIGNPFIGEISNMGPKTVVVVEVSSFQLETIEAFRPHVAVLLNLSENHFDWHGNFENYVKGKWRIFENQLPDDYAVVNVSDLETMRRIETIKSQKVFFNGGELSNPNFAACLAVAAIFRLDESKARRMLADFRGLEHRLEEVCVKDGVRYINDSKSTTISSLGWALERMKKKVILIMGGLHKGGDFGKVKELVEKKVKFLLLIGTAAELLESVFGKNVPALRAESLAGAVRHARAVARSGDTVLFSPACASFDMFRDYQDRGKTFKEIVTSLAGVDANSVLSGAVQSNEDGQ